MRMPNFFRSRAPGRRKAVRTGAVAALVAAVVVPHVRRQLRIPAAVTIGSTVAAPLAISVLWPRTRTRDVALFASQMWAFAVSHELPYDDPERLRQRLKINYPIEFDRWLGRGRLPNAWLQQKLQSSRFGRSLTEFSAWTHWFWFIQPYATLLWVLIRHNDRFPASARQMAAVFDVGCVLYFVVPTAPPWWASENGYTEEEVKRVMIEFGERIWGPAWSRIFGTLASNPWAAMPSLHFATALLAAILLHDVGNRFEKTVGWGYAGSLGFALVYLGEHYVTDLLAGAAVVLAVRKGEPLARPLVNLVNARLQRLEVIASGA